MRETDCKPKADQKNSERGALASAPPPPPLAKSYYSPFSVYHSRVFLNKLLCIAQVLGQLLVSTQCKILQ